MRIALYLVLLLLVAACMLLSQLSFAQECPTNPPMGCIHPDVDKPHSACPDSECWSGCTDPGYENTSTQAASANVIYTQCCCCCGFTQEDVYRDIISSTGNVGQFPEEETLSIHNWIEDNCSLCSLQINIAHKGYVDTTVTPWDTVPPVNPANVSFAWVHQEISLLKHVKIWVVCANLLSLPLPPTGKQSLSQELTYRLGSGSAALIHDSDCDVNGSSDDYYIVGSDANGEYLQDYFSPGIHGYLYGVISVSGPGRCEYCAPSLTELGRILLIVIILGSAVFIMLRRRKKVVPA